MAAGSRSSPMRPTWLPATPTARATSFARRIRSREGNEMRIRQKLSTLATAAGLAMLLAAHAAAGDGEIMFVNSFEGTGNVPQFVPVADQAAAAGRFLLVDIDTSDPANQAGLTFSLADAPSGMSIRASDGGIEWTPTAGQVGSGRPFDPA